MAETHINAYYAELAEAERELAQAQGKVNGLKETIATMEQSAKEAAGEVPATGEEATETAADESVEDLEKLKRDELEAKAKEAGVEDPSAAANKHDLAEETVAAQADQPAEEAPADETPAEDASEPSEEVPAPEAETPAEDSSEPAEEPATPAEPAS